ncbi:MAG: hypothetical protein JWM95_4971 [Gemmatimonadetes bacterium]|nr:hypothetical protein [Gemmatimonadota bacterium]
MSAMELASPDTVDVGMPHEVEQLRATIAEQLRGAGVEMPEERLDTVAEAILADAVRLALEWIERP